MAGEAPPEAGDLPELDPALIQQYADLFRFVVALRF